MNRYQAALADASRKYDTPRRQRPKSCDGTKESDRELRRRLNWLRNKVAETA